MSMEHKAYAFDWQRFECDLHPLLVQALADNDPADLQAYIDQHLAELTDPYEGEPLPADWRNGLENLDIQEYGDYALTRYYDPAKCFGVGDKWVRLNDTLPDLAAKALLGFPVGAPGRMFDPGRCGSYFQTPAQVQKSLSVLAPLGMSELAQFERLLERCAADDRGLYLTF